MYKALDLFCGLGGWSKGLDAEGFDVTGVDIANVGYPFRLILKDVHDLTPTDCRGFDIIVGSPPCRDFSKIGDSVGFTWRDPPDFNRGLQLVDIFLSLVQQAGPQIWLLENSDRLAPILKERYGLDPIVVANLTRGMRRGFWGNFPFFLITRDMTRARVIDISGRLRSWSRAEIPFPIAREFAKNCRLLLEKGGE